MKKLFAGFAGTGLRSFSLLAPLIRFSRPVTLFGLFMLTGLFTFTGLPAFTGFDRFPARETFPLSDTVRSVQIEVAAGMQYAPLRFRVGPGERIRLIFTNTGDMSHNLLITSPGKREEIVEKALTLSGTGSPGDYIPASSDVLWATRLLDPGEKDSVEFSAPEKEGVYPYVCTFPGHGTIMYGAMYVTGEEELPARETDPNIPEAGKTAGAPHPYELAPPYFYRMYMPGASPAAIAVRLSEQVSYCWDAGSCQLLYSWEGGFIDNSIAWKGHRDAEATLLGTVFYSAGNRCPLRLDDPARAPEVDYKGFRLVEAYPEFHFTVDGQEVYQLVRPDESGRGLVVSFRIPGYRQGLWLDLSAEGNYHIAAATGRRQDDLLRIPAGNAEEFSLTIMPRSAPGAAIKDHTR